MLRFRQLAWFIPLCLAGCEKPASVPLMDVKLHDELRSEYLMPTEPETVISLHELYDRLSERSQDPAENAPDPAYEEIVVVGRVGDLDDPDNPNEPNARWTRNFAEFRLLDPAGDAVEGESHEHGEHHHEHGDADHECPFCAEEGPGIQTIARFVNEKGELLPVDARVLFQLDGNDLVVVRGHAQLEPGTIVIRGTGLHVRR